MNDKTRADARQRIVEATRAVVSATGPAIVSMRQVADRAGVSVGTVSYHFPDKEDLLEECLDPFYRELDGLWAETAPLLGEKVETEVARAFLDALFDMLRAHRNLLRVRVALAMGRGEVPHRRLQTHLLRYVGEAQPSLKLPRQTLVLRFHAVHVMLVRHCTMAPDEWLTLTGDSTVEEATATMRHHLVDAALGILDLRS